MNKEKCTITIGNGKDHAGVFNKMKTTITLVVIMKGHSDDKKAQRCDMFERMALMTGSIYKKTDNDNNDIYTLECFKVKQLERLAPVIEKIYTDYYKHDVSVVVDKSCYGFLNE